MSGKHRFRGSEGLSTVAISIAAVILALSVSALIIMLMGMDPVDAIRNLVIGALGNKYSIAETLVKMSPLVCTGLSFAIASRCGLLNIGAEGQLLIGGLFGGSTAIYVHSLPLFLDIT